MPAVVDLFREQKDYAGVRELQKDIVRQYRGDFGKHIDAKDLPRIRMVWESIPIQLAKENKKFFFGQIKKPTVFTQRAAAKYTKAKEVVIPAGYKAIGAEAFQKNGIDNIKFPAGLKEIGKMLFDSAEISKLWNFQTVSSGLETAALRTARIFDPLRFPIVWKQFRKKRFMQIG